MTTDSLAGPLPRCSTDDCPNWVWARVTADGFGERVPVSDKCYKCSHGVLTVNVSPQVPPPVESP
jgi:hypothetical protein